jgi:hypothetical protein
MRPLARPTPALRATALLALGALAVHELRYALAYGSDAGQALARQGHGYLGELAPALFVLAISAILGRLVAAALGGVREADPARASARHTTLAFAAALLVIFCAQELVEGAVFAGHPGGLAAIFAHGGWLALPLALATGFLAARADRLLAGVERAVAPRVAGRRRLPRPGALPGPGAAHERRPLAACPLAFGLARRPPPAHSVS